MAKSMMKCRLPKPPQHSSGLVLCPSALPVARERRTRPEISEGCIRLGAKVAGVTHVVRVVFREDPRTASRLA